STPSVSWRAPASDIGCWSFSSGPKALRLSVCRLSLPWHTASRQRWFQRLLFRWPLRGLRESIPSTEMGGDLIDVVESDGRLLAYIADISGHGLPAGQLMGMLKTAMRVSRQLGQEPVAMLESVDRVLPTVKEPNMYATLALMSFDDSSEAEYSLAGHPPIL